MGIIDKAVAANPQEAMPEEAMQQETVSPEAEGMDYQNPEAVRAGMEIPAELQDAYDKIIKAGLKLMFDPTMRKETFDFIEQSNGDPAKLAEGVMSVVVMLHQESNGTLPPNLIIPSGVELMVHAAGVAKEGGMDITNEILAEGIAEMVQQTLAKFGVSPEQMQQMMSGMNSGESPEAQEPMQEPMPNPAGGAA